MERCDAQACELVAWVEAAADRSLRWTAAEALGDDALIHIAEDEWLLITRIGVLPAAAAGGPSLLQWPF